jgi:cytochrome c-type biogenesis protein CcmH/NrfG
MDQDSLIVSEMRTLQSGSESYMASVKRVTSRTYLMVAILVVLVGSVIGWFVYENAQDARQAAEAMSQEERAPPPPPESQKEAGLGRTQKSLQDPQQEKGLKWVQNGDKAAADGLTDEALVAYETALGYLEDSGGCQNTMAKIVRKRIANIQRKPYDVPCTAGQR